jgi:hypothetical protein
MSIGVPCTGVRPLLARLIRLEPIKPRFGRKRQVRRSSPPWNPQQPDRVKVTVGRDVSIDLSEAQSLGRCGTGAELPRAIVILARAKACRVRLDVP